MVLNITENCWNWMTKLYHNLYWLILFHVIRGILYAYPPNFERIWNEIDIETSWLKSYFVSIILKHFFLDHPAKGLVSYFYHLISVVSLSVVNIFKDLLLWNHRTCLSKTWPHVQSSLGCLVWKIFFWCACWPTKLTAIKKYGQRQWKIELKILKKYFEDPVASKWYICDLF